MIPKKMRTAGGIGAAKVFSGRCHGALLLVSVKIFSDLLSHHLAVIIQDSNKMNFTFLKNAWYHELRFWRGRVRVFIFLRRTLPNSQV
jgi:hypothetical protein